MAHYHINEYERLRKHEKPEENIHSILLLKFLHKAISRHFAWSSFLIMKTYFSGKFKHCALRTEVLKFIALV